jgi:hypothetical protein
MSIYLIILTNVFILSCFNSPNFNGKTLRYIKQPANFCDIRTYTHTDLTKVLSVV